MHPDVASRLTRLLEAARRIAHPRSAFGARARERLLATSGLSAAGVELALERSLECAPSNAELEALAAYPVPAPHVHVLLSAGVFTAAHRAIALALAASPHVSVRPSRRDPVFAELLHETDPELFRLTPELSPKPGEHVYAYGSADTLNDLRQRLPRGVVLHPHGPGFGAISLDETAEFDAALLARDVAVFDQRGCLSPRVVVVEGREEFAWTLAERLAHALAELAVAVPVGQLSPTEQAAIARYRDAWAYAGRLFPAAHGFVSVAPANAPFDIAPVGRNLHVLVTNDAAGMLGAHARNLTTYAAAGTREFETRVRQTLPRARYASIGKIQSPAFDGPVDRRAARDGELL